MGNVVSYDSKLAPISFASTILSFITFSTTFATFVYTFWSDASTARRAATEVHDILGALGISLREEHNILHRLRKRCARRQNSSRPHAPNDGDLGERADFNTARAELMRRSSRRHQEQEKSEEEAVWRSLENSCRQLIKQWEGIEVHFRSHESVRQQEDEESYFSGGGHGHRRRRRNSGFDEKITGWQGDQMEAQIEEKRRYGGMSLARRWLWVRKKTETLRISQALTRMQTRRIARQMADANIMAERIMDTMLDIGERVDLVEARLNRVVGVRKVD